MSPGKRKREDQKEDGGTIHMPLNPDFAPNV